MQAHSSSYGILHELEHKSKKFPYRHLEVVSITKKNKPKLDVKGEIRDDTAVTCYKKTKAVTKHRVPARAFPLRREISPTCMSSERQLICALTFRMKNNL